MLAFPKDAPANRPTGAHHFLKEVRTIPANPDSLKLVPREMVAESGFKLNLLNLTLQLLGALLAFATKPLHLLAHILDYLVLLGKLEVVSFIVFFLSRLADDPTLRVDTARQLKIQRPLFSFHAFALATNLQFSPLRFGQFLL